MATLITLKLRKKNILFTKAITFLIWVFLKFLVQRTETLLVLFRLRREFFSRVLRFSPLLKRQQSTFQFGLSHPYIGSRTLNGTNLSQIYGAYLSPTGSIMW